jgi:hypothetical protein
MERFNSTTTVRALFGDASAVACITADAARKFGPVDGAAWEMSVSELGDNGYKVTGRQVVDVASVEAMVAAAADVDATGAPVFSQPARRRGRSTPRSVTFKGVGVVVTFREV